jgi:hypothetical protein
MKQEPAPKSHRIAALFAAAAFLPTPLFAQDTTSTQTPPVLSDPSPPVTTTPPVVASPPPIAAEVPPVTTTAPPPQVPRAPLLTTPLPAEEPAATTNNRPARTTRAAPPAARAAPRLRSETTTRSAAPGRPAPVEAPAPAAAPLAAGPEGAAPAPATPEAIPPADAPPAAAPPVAADPAATAPQATESQGGTNWLWLLLPAALLLGALALFARRRRPANAHEREEVYEQPAYHHEPAHEPALVADSPTHHAEPAHAPATAATLGTAAGAATAEQGRPWLELLMRPVRAGVEGQDAIVEFELSVDNQGSAPARDVRVSTWMFPAGTAQESEAERMLIDRSSEASLPELTLAPGDAKRIATAVALPTGGIAEDAVLPVVVADARYMLPDGSEGRTSVCFAVGVPDGEELAHFAIDNPSGLHEGVEARPLGEPERV